MSADEFETIAKLFAPLAAHEGARGLIDDAALYAGHIITTDAIVEGVHFLPDDPIDTVAKKALRVNFSDLAAKGAKPVAVLLTLIWPDARPSSQIAAFARGLGEDLQRYNVALLGGDTTSTPGPLTISVTAFGEPLGARTPARADAKPGEDVWVTGTIGDPYLGLLGLKEITSSRTIAQQSSRDPGANAEPMAPGSRLSLREAGKRDQVIGRYRLPEPRVAFAGAVARFASASMDVSDGLAQDAGKIAAASGVALKIDGASVPISEAGAGWDLSALVSGGDDYEILFTASPAVRAEIEAASQAAGVAVTRIGTVEEGAGATILGADGKALALKGWRHKLGS